MVYFTEAPMQPNQMQPQQTPMQQQPNMPPQQQDDLGVNPPEMPPDFTTGAGGMNQNTMQDPNAMGGMGQDPNQQMMQGDPNQQMMDPNAQQDPNAMGGEIQADPVAAQGPEDELKQTEKEVFSDLTPEQMIIKNAELKDRYRVLHSVIIDSIDKINKISHTTYDDAMLDFIVRKLVSIKTMLRDTLIDVFPTRTYAENKIELQRFIMVYNKLANMISAIYQSRVKRQQKIAELNNTNQNSRDPEEFPLFTRGYDVQ